MLRIISVTIQNFLTIGQVSQTIDLSIDGLTLVLGENADLGSINSRNGVGKTAILQAICYVLFGKPLTKIRLDNLVNNINGKAMLVAIDFEVNGKAYRIERGRKPNVLRFFKDGVAAKELDEAQGENKNTQVEIDRLVGMSATLFKHLVALNTFTAPFLREEASVQREVIEELFGIMQLSQRADALKKLIDVTKEQLRDAEAALKANTEANARIDQGIGRLTVEAQAWRTSQDRRIAELATQVAALQAIDIDHEIAVFDDIERWQEQKRETDGRRQTTEQTIAALTQETERLRKMLVRYEAEAHAADRGEISGLERQAQLYLTEADQDVQPQIARLRSEVVRRQQEAASKYAEANQLAVELSEVMQQLAQPSGHRCTTCGQGLVGTDHLATVVANLTRREQTLTDKITRLLSEQDQASQEATDTEGEIDRVQVADQQHRDYLRAKAAAVQIEIARTKEALDERRALAQAQADEVREVIADIDHEQQALVALLGGLPSLGAMPVSAYKSRDAVWQLRQDRDRRIDQLDGERAKPNPHDGKIEALRGTLIVIDYAELNELNSRFKHETFLHKLLTAKDSFIRKKIIDQNLRYLNKRLDHYLQRLGLPHEVQFMADLTVEICLLGAEFDFEQLSRGEMNRVIMATSWAFRDVWENLNTRLNLLFVDEMLDQGTDGAGVEAALDILTGIAAQKSVFLISHRDELRDRIDNVMIVRKENQFTTFA